MKLRTQVFEESTQGVQPLTWRRSLLTPATLAPSRTLDEAAQLRAKLAELSASIEIQARQAHESGIRAGEAAARDGFESELHKVTDRLAATIADVAGTRIETIRRAEADTVRLALEIARRVLHREIAVDNSAIEALVKAALDKLAAQEVYRVRVHPSQERLLRSCLEQAGRGQSIEVIGDPAQPKGGAVFELSRGSLDASVDTQLDEIERGLTDQLEARL